MLTLSFQKGHRQIKSRAQQCMFPHSSSSRQCFSTQNSVCHGLFERENDSFGFPSATFLWSGIFWTSNHSLKWKTYCLDILSITFKTCRMLFNHSWKVYLLWSTLGPLIHGSSVCAFVYRLTEDILKVSDMRDWVLIDTCLVAQTLALLLVLGLPP